MRLHRARCVRTLHRDVVLCVSQATLSVSSCVCLVAGALRRIHAEALLPPDPKGWISAVATPATLSDLLGARAEGVPDYSSHLLRIPWSAKDSGLSIHPRDSVDLAASALWAIDDCTRSGRASRCGPTLPQARLHALLNASAASETTTAGGLEAFSQGSAGAERF